MQTIESFQNWCKKKIKIQDNNWRKIVENWEFWTFNLGENIWWEISAWKPFIRVWLVLNAKIPWDLVLIIPLSTKVWTSFIKDNFYKEVVRFSDFWLDQKSYFVLNQFKLVSKKRLIKNLWMNKDKVIKCKKYPWELRKELKEFIKFNFLK